MSKLKPINVYWAPMVDYDNGESDMLYTEPQNMFDYLTSLKSDISFKNTFFACPAFTEKMKRTFFFTSPISVSYEYHSIDGYMQIKPNDKSPSIGTSTLRPETLKDNPLFQLNLFFSLFAEESLETNFSAPYFHESKYTRYGSVCPGTFNIGKWFRPYPLEINMWNPKGTISFEEGEPLFYVEFLTDRPINIIRFKHTKNSSDYGKACAKSSEGIMKKFPLVKRYEIFKRTRIRELLLKEIKSNILD
jgi:hypothetical protein